MKLYVCWGTFPIPGPWGHPCRNAHQALRAAGHDPQVKRVFGEGRLPDALNGPRRKHVKEISGDSWVPVLELDDGTVVSGSKEIAAWAGANSS